MRGGARVALRVGEHASAGVDAEDLEVGKTVCGGAKEVTVTDAGDEEAFAVGEGVEVCDTCALKARAGENALKPSVMRREEIEAHDGV